MRPLRFLSCLHIAGCDPEYGEDVRQNPVGAGPYKLKSG